MLASLISLFAVSMMFVAPEVEAPAQSSSLVDEAALEQSGFVRYWSGRLPLSDGESVRSAYLVDENIYFISDLGGVYAVEAGTGLIRWAINLSEPYLSIYKPHHFRSASDRNVVVFATSSKVNILDRYTGEILASSGLPAAEGSAIIAQPNALFMGSYDGRFYSLYMPRFASNKSIPRWQVVTDGPVTAAPMFDGQGRLVFASRGGKVYACEPEDKTYLWSFDADGPIHGDPVAGPDGVYVASMDRSLYKLEGASGEKLWQSRFPWPLSEGPVFVARTVYQFCEKTGLSAIDSETGKVRWLVDNGRSLAAHSGDRDIVHTTDGYLLMVDHTSGAVLATIGAPSVMACLSNITDNAIYAYSAGGELFCAKPDSVPYLRRQQILAARAQLNQPPKQPDATAVTTGASTDTTQDSDPFRSRWDRPKK